MWWRQAERFWISAPGLHLPPNYRAINQRERNDSKSREMFGRAAPASGPVFPPSFIFLGLSARRLRINSRRKIRPTYNFCKILVFRPGRCFEQPCRQPKRDKSRGRPLRRQGPCDQKSPRFLVVSLPLAPKLSEILEPSFSEGL